MPLSLHFPRRLFPTVLIVPSVVARTTCRRIDRPGLLVGAKHSGAELTKCEKIHGHDRSSPEIVTEDAATAACSPWVCHCCWNYRTIVAAAITCVMWQQRQAVFNPHRRGRSVLWGVRLTKLISFVVLLTRRLQCAYSRQPSDSWLSASIRDLSHPPPLGGGRGKNGLHSSVRLMLLRTTELSRLAILERRWDGRTAWEARWSSSERQKKLIESDMFWVCYIYHAYHIACLSCVTAQMRNRGYARDCPNMRTIGPPLRCPFCQSTIEYGEENTRTGVKEIQIWREEMW